MKKLDDDDIRLAAKNSNIPYAALKAVIEVETGNRSGFDKEGKPVILFEPHIFWRELDKVYYYTKREQMNTLFPDICAPKWDKSIYNTKPQHVKLTVAAALHWEAAHKSASWGLGQVMGFNALSIGYKSIQEFVDAMYESEAKQLDAMIKFIIKHKLDSRLRQLDWAGFALGYNGASYAKNAYDTKLKKAYLKYK